MWTSLSVFCAKNGDFCVEIRKREIESWETFVRWLPDDDLKSEISVICIKREWFKRCRVKWEKERGRKMTVCEDPSYSSEGEEVPNRNRANSSSLKRSEAFLRRSRGDQEFGRRSLHENWRNYSWSSRRRNRDFAASLRVRRRMHALFWHHFKEFRPTDRL